MSRNTSRLTALVVLRLDKKGRYCDGGGLYLQVSATARKCWVFRYMLRGRMRDMGLGPYPVITLAAARDRAIACRRMLIAGIDPIEARRNRWIPADVNRTVKNAETFDVLATKENGNRTVRISIKTCGPDQRAFQFGGFKNKPVIGAFGETDFTILVCMGHDRRDDQFYVVPTPVVRQQINKHRDHYLSILRKDGVARKDLGHWTLHLAKLSSGEDRPSHGLENLWQEYLGNWKLLDGSA